MTAASTLEWTPSLRKIAFTCNFTVPSEIPRSRAIDLLLWPLARKVRISVSRGVSSLARVVQGAEVEDIVFLVVGDPFG